MGLDARVRYTKMVINQSIAALLQQKPFHKVSLAEVCKFAEINRATFYRHYKDLYDWKEQLEQECLDRTKAVLENCQEANLTETLAEQLRDMRNNAELYRLISSPNFESNALELALSMILENADSETKKRLALDSQKDFYQKWDCYYLIYGCLGIIECWVKDGMREAPEELARYYTDNLHRHIAGTQSRK